MSKITNPLFGSGNYQFGLVKFPEIEFFLTETSLPGISIGKIIQPTQIHDFPIPGESMDFEDLNLTFTISEDLANYNVIHNWIVGMGFPESSDQYRKALANANNATSMTELAKGYTDATLVIFGNNSLPLISVLFKDCFPVSLSGIQFNSQNSDSEPLIASATFTYSSYSYKLV